MAYYERLDTDTLFERCCYLNDVVIELDQFAFLFETLDTEYLEEKDIQQGSIILMHYAGLQYLRRTAERELLKRGCDPCSNGDEDDESEQHIPSLETLLQYEQDNLKIYGCKPENLRQDFHFSGEGIETGPFVYEEEEFIEVKAYLNIVAERIKADTELEHTE